jgi:hypothetical protein
VIQCIKYSRFSGLVPFFSTVKTKAKHFDSWLNSHLQAELPVVLGPIEGAKPGPGIGINS